MPRLIVIAAVSALAALCAGCISVDVQPTPDLRVELDDGTSTIHHDGDSISVRQGEVVKLEVLSDNGSGDSCGCQDSSDSSCRCNDEKLRIRLEDEDTVGVIPHWEDRMWVLYGKAKGRTDIKVQGATYTIIVED